MEGSGPVILEAQRSFRGDIGDREAFSGWGLTGSEVRRTGSGPALDLGWNGSFSGGTGHTCWAEVFFSAHLAEDEAAATLQDPNGREAMDIPVDCA